LLSEGIRFETEWAQKWAQFENLADFLAAQSCSKLLILFDLQVALELATLRLKAPSSARAGPMWC
jgi:hypothetical protein